jgi:hypothetical protein
LLSIVAATGSNMCEAIGIEPDMLNDISQHRVRRDPAQNIQASRRDHESNLTELRNEKTEQCVFCMSADKSKIEALTRRKKLCDLTEQLRRLPRQGHDC